MARRSTHDVEFGSDSFLDVIANIVGILVILSVLVGLRVRQHTTAEPDGETTRVDEVKDGKNWQRERERILGENARRRAAHEQALAERTRELERRQQQQRQHEAEQRRLNEAHKKALAEAERSEALLRTWQAEAETIAAQIKGLEKSLAERRASLALHSAEFKQYATEEARLRDAMTQWKDQVDAKLTDVKEAETQVARLARQVTDLEAIRRDLLARPKPGKTWIHYATPLAQTSEGKELHYRLLGGRVANTRLEELVETMKNDVTLKGQRNELSVVGTVGPIGGFRLRYQLERLTPSLTARVQNPFELRVRLAGFEVFGDSDDLGEPFATALQPGSEFQRSLGQPPASEVAITLWVYPDSFAAAKAVQTFLNERGYRVALRPLPFGMAIRASPHGSASRFQ